MWKRSVLQRIQDHGRAGEATDQTMLRLRLRGESDAMKYVCPRCDYHGDTIRGIVPTECWSCGAKLSEHICPKCGSEMASCVFPDGSWSIQCPECRYNEQHESGHSEKVMP